MGWVSHAEGVGTTCNKFGKYTFQDCTVTSFIYEQNILMTTHDEQNIKHQSKNNFLKLLINESLTFLTIQALVFYNRSLGLGTRK